MTECERQIALADVVILNKLDLITTAQKEKVTNRIQSINSSCDIQYTTHSRVDLDTILGIQAYSSAAPPRYKVFYAMLQFPAERSCIEYRFAVSCSIY